MAYIDQHLMSGERIVYRARLHWSVFFAPAIFALITLVCLVRGPESAAFVPFLAIVTVATGFAAMIATSTSEFGVTNKRVLIKTGLIRRQSLETLLVKIEGIQVCSGGFLDMAPSS